MPKTPVILALTRRATILGLPYNTFITWLIAGCVIFIWIESVLLASCVLMTSYLYCNFICRRDSWALDIFLMHLQQIGIGASEVKHYLQLRSYSPE